MPLAGTKLRSWRRRLEAAQRKVAAVCEEIDAANNVDLRLRLNAAQGTKTSAVATFQRSKEREGWPEPVLFDPEDLSNDELANYLAACGPAYDGMNDFLRSAIVRLLRST